jgi:hypothetical protein
VLLMAVAVATPLRAQVENPFGPGSQLYAATSNAKEENGSSDPQTGVGAPPADESISSGSGMVFVIPGVVTLEELSGTGIIFGAGLSEGYGKVHSATAGNPSGSISVAQPYVGFYQAGRRHKMLLEYSPTADLVNQEHWDGSILQRGGVRVFDVLSERWRWFFSAYSTYGTEFLRELGGISMGNYPGYLTFSAPTDTRLVATGMTGLAWRRTPRQQFSVSFGDTYSYTRLGPHYEAGSARLQMTNYYARNSNWYLYTQAHRYSDQPGCTRIGAGLGVDLNFGSHTSLALEAGPQYGSGPCIVRWSSVFAGYFAKQFTARTTFYVSAARDLIEPYLLQSRWTDIVSARLEHPLNGSITVAAGAGYLRSSDLPGASLGHYRSWLASSEFRWKLSNSLSFVASYRYFKRDFGTPGLENRHSWVFASIVWHPVSRIMRPYRRD